MKYTIEQLSYIVPAISIGFLFIITSINVYFKIRRRFPATVNCWFCNENSKVPYDDLNKWTCPKCEQYNGFTEDGDYNCDIPAQRSVKLNKWKTSSFSSMNGSIISGRLASVNGLCEPCNRNQELKVQQLASFEPENEAYFDEEIEEYRRKLEQAYRLCPRCERHLKRTLNKVKTNILGSKLKQIGTRGLQAFDLNLSQKANKVIVYKKRLTFARISLGALILISLLQLFTTTNQINITKSKLDTVFNSTTSTLILTILSYISAAKILILQMIQSAFALPYIQFAVASIQLFIKYMYNYINGDFWKLINTEFFKLIELSVAEEEINPGFSSLSTNVSGCFLSIFLLFLFGLGWGSVLSLLLWSLNMVLPVFMQNVPDQKDTLLLDVIQLTLVWSSAMLSIINFFKLPNKQIKLDADKNSSFHRIDSEMNSDVSDESEIESEINLSLQSNLSSGSKRSIWNETKVLNSTIASRAPSVYSTNSLRQRPFVVSSQSIASTKPASDMNSSFGSDNFYRPNQMNLTRDRFNTSQRSFMTSPNIYNRNQCQSTMSLHSLNKTYNKAEASLRSVSRNSFYDVPNDFESGITQLSISGMGNKNQLRTFASQDMFNNTMSHRKSIISPSRLSLNESHHSVNQSSWLAGGYWNSTSPQKKTNLHSNDIRSEQHAVPKDVFPMISRTSSKSSGFESRENSLCDDTEIDRTFLFCEPASLTQSTEMSNGLIKPLPQKPLSTFNGLDGSNYQQSIVSRPTSSLFTTGMEKNSMLSHSFDQFSLRQPKLSSNYHNNSLHPVISNTKQFNRINTDLSMPSFQRGSLIKLQNQTTMDH